MLLPPIAGSTKAVTPAVEGVGVVVAPIDEGACEVKSVPLFVVEVFYNVVPFKFRSEQQFCACFVLFMILCYFVSVKYPVKRFLI